MANGKAKGSSWERDVCKFLTKWLTGTEKPYVFWRSPASGGIATMSFENKELSGDIVAMRPEGAFFTSTFSVECKVGYPKSSFDKHLKDNKNDEIKGFWSQACNDAFKTEKLPLLIYKKTNFPALLGLREEDFTSLEKMSKISLNSQLNTINMKWSDDTASLTFVSFEGFFSMLDPDKIKAFCKKHERKSRT
jgi:hypothetical protein